MTRALVMAALLAASCDAVFGLHDRAGIDARGDGATGDGAFGASATASLAELTVPNGSNDLPVTPQSIGLGSDRVTASATLDDGTVVAATFTAVGALTFPLRHEGEGYELSIALDGAAPDVFASSASHLVVSEQLVGRRRTALTQSTPLAITTDNYAYLAGDQLVIDSTGIWSSSAPGSGETELSTQFSLDWEQAHSLSGAIGAIDGSSHDTLALTALRDTNNGYFGIASLASTDAVTMTAGSASFVSLTMNTPSQTGTCFTLTADQDDVLAKLRQAYGSDEPASESDWNVAATAGPAFAVAAGLPLALSTMSVSAHPVSIVNPFPGTAMTVSLGGSLTGALQIPGRTPIALGPTFRVFDAITAAPGCATSPAVTLSDGAVGLPSNAAIAGVSPTSQGQSVSLDPSVAQPVSWSLASPGDVDLYGVTVFQLVAGVANDESIVERLHAVTTGTTVSLPPGLFEAGQFYAIEVVAVSGVPGAASGDFATDEVPFAFATSVTPAFLVEAR